MEVISKARFNMDNKEIWLQVLAIIKENTTAASYKTWFLPTHIRSLDQQTHMAYLESDGDFYVNILNNRYKPLLEDAFQKVMEQPYRVIIKKASDYDHMEEEQRQQQIVSPVKPGFTQQRIFNPRYTFDNFVVGASNKYAHAACLAVAEEPSKAYNPLFIYGGSGLGKTHLMHAIGIYLLENRPELNVLYVSTEMFTNELIKAIGENRTREFKNKYRHIDVLLIDDIQFLEGKDTTQEEFFYTFNTLIEDQKQIVISSDRPPNELTRLDERLTSRFSWNIIASLSPADYETRVAILMKKAENQNLEVTDDIYDVICLIAEKITDNIRELEGALNRIVSFSLITHEKIDLTFAKRILKDVIQNGSNSVTPEKIKTIVSRYFQVEPSDLESSTRAKAVAFPRQIAMYLCRDMTDYSFNKIGNLFGNRHYSTVMHACEKIQQDIRDDDSVKTTIEKLKSQIQE
jgi:chromosomal replication initiator protein